MKRHRAAPRTTSAPGQAIDATTYASLETIPRSSDTGRKREAIAAGSYRRFDCNGVAICRVIEDDIAVDSTSLTKADVVTIGVDCKLTVAEVVLYLEGAAAVAGTLQDITSIGDEVTDGTRLDGQVGRRGSVTNADSSRISGTDVDAWRAAGECTSVNSDIACCAR